MRIIILIFTTCFFASSDAIAENVYKETIIRCDKGIVSINDPEAMLFVKCGQPMIQRSVAYKTDQFTYITDGFVRVVTVKHGNVVKIITAGRTN